MNRRGMISLAALLLLGIALPLAAHDDKIHKATVGQVTAATAEGLDLKTKTATVKVKYSSKTTFELNEKPADKSGVKVGTWVGVIGSKLPSGELMANEVLLNVPAPKAEAPKPSAHKH